MSVNSLTLSRWANRTLLGVALIALGGYVHAQEPGIQSLDAVRKAAESALRRQIEPAAAGVMLEAGNLDSRLRLAACPAALVVDVALPRGTQSRVLARVS